MEKGMMDIFRFQEYAKEHGYNTGRFITINEKGFFELQWVDAYYGFIKFINPKIDGVIRVKELRELFGDDQKYFPTIGYDDDSIKNKSE